MDAKILTSEQGTRINLMGDAVRIILSSDDTGGALTLVQQHSMPGAGVPMHVHSREDEVFQIIEGLVEFHVGDETITAAAGTFVYGPKGLPHSFRVVGTEPALLQIMMVPGGMDGMVREISALPAPDPQSVGAICERYGITFMTPPPGHDH